MNSASVDAPRHFAPNARDQLQGAESPVIKEGKRQAGILLDQSGQLIEAVSTRAVETAAESPR